MFFAPSETIFENVIYLPEMCANKTIKGVCSVILSIISKREGDEIGFKMQGPQIL